MPDTIEIFLLHGLFFFIKLPYCFTKYALNFAKLQCIGEKKGAYIFIFLRIKNYTTCDAIKALQFQNNRKAGPGTTKKNHPLRWIYEKKTAS